MSTPWPSARWTGTIDAGWLWLFVPPSGQVTSAITLKVTTLIPAIPLLEELYYADITVAGRSLPEALARLATEVDPHPDPIESNTNSTRCPLTTSCSGSLTAPTSSRKRNSNSAICHPPELNCRPTTAGTIGLLFAFLGVNAREVDATRSMFDGTYVPIYLAIAAIVLGGLSLFTGLSWADRCQATPSQSSSA